MIKPQIRDQLVKKAIAEVFRRASDQKLKTIFGVLAKSYGERHRHYHTLDHVAEILALSENFPLDNAQAFKAAVLFHDVIYDPARYASNYHNISNEGQSSIICMNEMDAQGIKPNIVARAKNLILMTKDHVPPKSDHEAALFLDMDLAILGMPRSRYEFYAFGTAREFLSSFTPNDYIKGRKLFLNGILDRDTIYQTSEFSSTEKMSRENVLWELENLDRIVARAFAANEKTGLNASLAPTAS
jgi:predicted metal-dependent HD superfamily phosphohydrolase